MTALLPRMPCHVNQGQRIGHPPSTLSLMWGQPRVRLQPRLVCGECLHGMSATLVADSSKPFGVFQDGLHTPQSPK